MKDWCWVYKVFKDFCKFLNGLARSINVVIPIITVFGYFAFYSFSEKLKEFYWVPWVLLTSLLLFIYVLTLRGIVSLYPRPEFADDFRTIADCFRGFMSDSNFYSGISNVVTLSKIPQHKIEAIYTLSEQMKANPIKIRNRRLRRKYLKFWKSLEDLIEFLEQNYSIDGAWSIMDSHGLSNTEISRLRLKCGKKLKVLSISYRNLFSEISHLGGTPFQVNLIY